MTPDKAALVLADSHWHTLVVSGKPDGEVAVYLDGDRIEGDGRWVLSAAVPGAKT